MGQNITRVGPVDDAEQCAPSERQRDDIDERFWQAVERIGARNADKDPDEVYREVTEVVEEVRRERYERSQWRVS
jgi:hypothetical protein